ncbi:MAG: hypothetical protein JWN80_2497 [Microbacteriaceae bacterium]|nr:hypothetical protein [Microbacteriaceae bacterium]
MVTIDQLLNEHFAREGATLVGRKKERLDLVEQRLREFLETRADRILETGQLIAVEAAREAGVDAAFCLTCFADDLIFALPLYLEDVDFTPADREDRRVQLAQVQKLADFVRSCRLFSESDMSCPLLDLGYQLREGKRLLAASRW